MRSHVCKYLIGAELMAKTERAVVVGAGGHASVIVDVLEEMGNVEVVGFVSVGQNDTLYNYPRLGGDEALPSIYQSGVRSALLAVGDNRRRASLMNVLLRCGFSLMNAISPAAWISRHVAIGKGIAILPGAVVNARSTLGDAAIVNTNASVDHDCVLGRYVHIGPGVSIAGGVRLGEGVLLGTGSSVIPQVSIADWTVVGAGATVTRDLPANVLAVGVPAAVSKHIEWSER